MEPEESLADILRKRRELRYEKQRKVETEINLRHNEIKQKLKMLQDERTRMKENINKNLKGITMQKHAVQKIVQGSDDTTVKLPVTHKHQQQIIGLVSDAIVFVNDFSKMHETLEPGNGIDTVKICNEIRSCGESVNEELNRARNRVEQVVTLSENAENIKQHCFLSCDDEQGLDGSVYDT